jgi:3-isopropylmalate/(R)-2-methylmalate dehydratase large subunit
MPRTIIDKVWDMHVVAQEPGAPAIFYIDLHLIHEVTSPQAFAGLRARGIGVRRPDRTLATMDHCTPTRPGGLAIVDAQGVQQLQQLSQNCREFGITLHELGSEHNGIVHVIGPELGYSLPGQTIVCGDSHTSTHGAFGALAFGIGTSEVEHVLATQCLLQQRPKTFEVRFEGKLRPGTGAKDMILALIAKIGTDGGTGHVFEYCGSAIDDLDMDGRLTICNMSIEAGARAGLIAPDEKTYRYLQDRPQAPKGAAWERALAHWKSLPTDPGAVYDRTITIDVSDLAPMITYGTNPGMGMPVDGIIPQPASSAPRAEIEAHEKAMRYMGLESGKPILGQPVDVVFVGSCTNSRITDLQAAASILKGRKVAAGVEVLIVPGSQAVKREAEALGLHRIFQDAGAQWREPGCSMCLSMNDDRVAPGKLAVSTSNRNFEGRQGPKSRTLLASPLTAAACALTGRVTDVRTLGGF